MKAEKTIQQDFDANHAPDGTLLENWPESNIFSIISSGDAVARVLPAAWGYHRNGCDRFLPATRNAECVQNSLKSELNGSTSSRCPQFGTFAKVI